MLPEVRRAEIVITNYHVFQHRETLALPKVARSFLQGNAPEPLLTTEYDADMLARACGKLLNYDRVNLINDEAHHIAIGTRLLLYFGATRVYFDDFAALYRRLLHAGLDNDRARIREAALEIGLLAGNTPARLEQAMLEMFEMSLQPLRQNGAFDFGGSDLAIRMREAGMAMAGDHTHF
jgi:hypothetical protein